MENEAFDTDFADSMIEDFSAMDELDLDFISESDEQLLKEYSPQNNTYSEGYYWCDTHIDSVISVLMWSEQRPDHSVHAGFGRWGCPRLKTANYPNLQSVTDDI